MQSASAQNRRSRIKTSGKTATVRTTALAPPPDSIAPASMATLGASTPRGAAAEDPTPKLMVESRSEVVSSIVSPTRLPVSTELSFPFLLWLLFFVRLLWVSKHQDGCVVWGEGTNHAGCTALVLFVDVGRQLWLVCRYWHLFMVR